MQEKNGKLHESWTNLERKRKQYFHKCVCGKGSLIHDEIGAK